MSWKKIDDKGIFEQEITPPNSTAKIRLVTEKSMISTYPKEQVGLMGMVQVARFVDKIKGKTIHPIDVLGKSSKEQIKLKTTNDGHWFLDVLDNTPYCFYQASWLTAQNIQTNNIFPLEKCKYHEDLKQWNETSTKAINLDEGSKFIGKEMKYNVLLDSIQHKDHIAVDFKTFAVILTKNGQYKPFEGLSWFWDEGEVTYLRLLTKEDNDLCDCISLFNNINITQELIVNSNEECYVF